MVRHRKQSNGLAFEDPSGLEVETCNRALKVPCGAQCYALSCTVTQCVGEVWVFVCLGICPKSDSTMLSKVHLVPCSNVSGTQKHGHSAARGQGIDPHCHKL